MKNNIFLKNLLKKGKKFTKVTAALLMACMLFGSSSIFAEAAVTLKDIFDTQLYSDTYSDLNTAFKYDKTALFQHYLTYGIKEKRQVGGLVDVVKYREAYADLDAVFGDNWDAYVNHYLTYGIKEGRDNFTDFDAYAYANRYADLKAAFGDDVLALYIHYLTYGKSEGRNIKTEVPVVAKSSNTNTSGGNTNTGNSGSGNGDNEEADGQIETRKVLQSVTVSSSSDGQTVTEYEYEFDNMGRLINEKGITDRGILEYRYTYDDMGNLTKKLPYYTSTSTSTGSGSSMRGRTRGFEREYDSAGRLVKEIEYWLENDGQPHATGQIYLYEYDAAGILSKKLNVRSSGDYTIETYQYDEDGNLISIIEYSEEGLWPECTQTFEYDDAGNCIGTRKEYAIAVMISCQQHIYDEAGRLVETVFWDEDRDESYAVSSKGHIEYTYDNDGDLIREFQYYEDGRSQSETIYTYVNIQVTVG